MLDVIAATVNQPEGKAQERLSMHRVPDLLDRGHDESLARGWLSEATPLDSRAVTIIVTAVPVP